MLWPVLVSLLLLLGCLGVDKEGYEKLYQADVQLQNQLASLNASNVQCCSQISSGVENISVQVSALQTQISELQKQVSDMESIIDSLNTKLEQITAENVTPGEVTTEKLVMDINMPLWFDKENDFEYWTVRVDGADITQKLPRSQLGQAVHVTGKSLSAGDHLLALAFYYPDGWWVRLVWNVTIPDKMFNQTGKDFEMDGFIINVPVLSSPPAALKLEEGPPVKVVMLTLGAPAEEPSKMECSVHVKSVINDPTLNVTGTRKEAIVDVWRPEDTDWVEAQSCMNLADGTKISTGYDSAVVLDFVPVPPCEEKTTTIASLTQLNVTANIFNQTVWQTKLKLDVGTINVDVKKGELKTDLKVATPNTTASSSG